MNSKKSIEAAYKRDRIIVISGIAVVSVLAWMYMLYLAGGMKNLDMKMEMSLPQMQSWGVVDFALMFVMWAVMMVAMMAPTTAPTVLMFTRIYRKRCERQEPVVSTAIFLLGYLSAWAWYSALATFGQWGLHSAALLSPMMTSTSPVFGGALLLAAGIFQFTPLKYACLTRCRSPLGFLLNEWREGIGGAFIMGMRNGNYCVVCCWALMSLMFAAGIMNLLWMAAIAAFVLVEKMAPGGLWVRRISELVLLLWGAWMFVRAIG